MTTTFNEVEHPRAAAGAPGGGQFTTKPGGAESLVTLDAGSRPRLGDELAYNMPIVVGADGAVSPAPGLTPPQFVSGSICEGDTFNWEPVRRELSPSGTTGSAWRSDSEVIDPALEEHLWNHPGTYVTVPAQWDRHASSPEGGGRGETHGWGLFRKIDPPTPPESSRYVQIDSWQRKEMLAQIGGRNILGISGGRVTDIPTGIELPVSNGYLVRIHLTIGDDYTVERVLRRGDKEWVKGSKDRVYCDAVSEQAYRASCFRSYDETEW